MDKRLDLAWGAKAIGEEIGLTEPQAHYALKAGLNSLRPPRRQEVGRRPARPTPRVLGPADARGGRRMTDPGIGAGVYRASGIKPEGRKSRKTKSEIAGIKRALFEILQADHPHGARPPQDRARQH